MLHVYDESRPAVRHERVTDWLSAVCRTTLNGAYLNFVIIYIIFYQRDATHMRLSYRLSLCHDPVLLNLSPKLFQHNETTI